MLTNQPTLKKYEERNLKRPWINLGICKAISSKTRLKITIRAKKKRC
jgi:hypothetical protein